MTSYSVVSMRQGEMYYTNQLSEVEAVQEKYRTMMAFNLTPNDVWIETELF
ncbi:hypothetical protein [uncultured Weissella sp.]|uniref:hypothetical protein n=1 Tax=Weissella viridescens TaxID=1629 RepID=UPI0027DCA363|nr:hypothetical protein [uncultured Weissella sp.]